MRRRFLSAVLATAALSTGALPLLGTAHASDCPTWTDVGGDSSLKQKGAAGTTSDTLDILSTTVATVGKNLVAAVKVTKLSTAYTDLGDRFTVNMTIEGSGVYLYSKRDAVTTGVVAWVSNLTGSATGTATADYDLATNTVIITSPLSEVDKAAGKATTGLAATGFQTTTTSEVDDRDVSVYDDSTAAATLSYTIGSECSSMIPTTTLPHPSADCRNISDPALDGKPKIEGSEQANETDLDVTDVAFDSTPTTLYAFIKVTTLGDKPGGNYQGDRFEFSFKIDTKTFLYSVGRMGIGNKTTNPNYAQLNGAASTKLTSKGVFDKASNTVIIVMDRAGLNDANGAPVADGTTVTATAVKTAAELPGTEAPADTAQATVPTDQVWKIGDNKCFPPPAGKLANVGGSTVQYTDAAALAAKLTSSTDAALSGKALTFTIGGKSVTATTGADGVAKASLNPGLSAGSYSLVVAFAGDASAGKVSITTPFTVTVERTKVVLSVVKSGTKRTVYAKLLDDDNHPVAGQTITWYVNGKKVTSSRTNASGVAVFTTAKPTQTVKATFAGVSGKYVTSTAQMKV